MHPNTHVNKAQSTNDTIPSATHLAVASELDRIIEGVEVPGDVFAAKAEAFRHVVKLGRTCCSRTRSERSSAAMPLSCGVWPASSVPCFRGALRSAWAGTGLGADPGYMDALYRHPSDIYGEEVRPTASLFDGLENADFFVTVSGLVKEVATLLSKITRDLRLMSSGPRSGFMEVRLPP